jgi:metal-sulfur cluster biosynthetic enzyme
VGAKPVIGVKDALEDTTFGRVDAISESNFVRFVAQDVIPSRSCLQDLRGVLDPEIGIDIVDLCLVYDAQARDGQAGVVMTMTSAACPLGEVLAADVERGIRERVPTITAVSVELVWDPP